MSFARVAKDFGICVTYVQKWVRQAEIEEGLKPGPTASELGENRELKKRVRLLEQENEVLRRAAAHLSQGSIPE